MIPITRIDEYLAVISQDEDATGLPDQAVTRIDTYLSKIAGEAVAELPEPVTRIDKYLASIAGMDVVMGEPITRIDYYLATVAGAYSGDLPEPVTRIDHYLYNWAQGGGMPDWTVFTGNPLQFNAPKAHTLRSVKVEFSPIQDLHGYANPWPAGGGKNTLDYDTVFANVKVGENDFEGALSDGFSGDKSLSQYIGKTITISCYLSSVSGYSNLYITTQVNGAYKNSNNVTEGNNGYISVTVTPETNADIWRFNYGSTTSNPKMLKAKDFQIEESPSRTPWTPYSNLCPISGYTGLSLYDDPAYGGTIWWNQVIQVTTDSTDNWTINNASAVSEDGKLVFTPRVGNWNVNFAQMSSISVPAIVGHKYLYQFYIKVSETKSKSLMYAVNLTSFVSKTLTANEDTLIEGIYTATNTNKITMNTYPWATSSTEQSGEERVEIHDYQVFDLTAMFGAGNEPATVSAFRELFPKDYYAYNSGTETCVSAVNGNPYWKQTVTWTDEAGTVYGGYVEVAEDGSVTLTATMASVDLGSLTWTYQSGSTRFYSTGIQGTVKAPASNASTIDAFCSVYKYVSLDILGTSGANNCCAVSTTKNVYVKDTAYTDPDLLKTALSGQKFVYELATPIVTHLDSVTQLTALVGINTMWSDTNGDLTVEARAEAVNLSALQSLNMLLGGRYYNNGTADEPTDEEALNILLGGNER